MSGTRLDWLSLGLANSLKHTLGQLIRWRNNTARPNGLQPCRACYFQSDSFPMVEWLCPRGSPRRHGNRQLQLVCGILRPAVLCDIGALGTSLPKGMVPAWEAAWLRDYDIGCWHEAYCNPTHWCAWNGNCKSLPFRNGSVRVINLHWHSCGCPPRKPMMQSYYSID